VTKLLNAKGNRLTQKTSPARPSTDQQYETRTLESGRNKKNDADLHQVDFDCDGSMDALVQVPDDVDSPMTLSQDSNDDGNFDIVIAMDRDGNPRMIFADSDFDGRPDVIGHYRPEKISHIGMNLSADE
jgi:hypothetical protein